MSSNEKTVLTLEVSAEMASAPIDAETASSSPKRAVGSAVFAGREVKADAEARPDRRRSFRSIVIRVLLRRSA